MCAYNVRHSGRVDHDPASGQARSLNFLTELLTLGLGLGLLFGVYKLVTIFLF